VHDLVGRGVFQQKAGGAVTEGGKDHLIGVESREHDHRRRVGAGLQLLGCGEPVHPGHADVHEDDVRTEPVDSGRDF